MNKYEKDEINSLPYKYRPMTLGSYIGYGILFAIPVVGLICILIFSFNSGSINRRSYARYWLFLSLLLILFIGAILAVIYFTGNWDLVMNYIMDFIKEYIPNFAY